MPNTYVNKVQKADGTAIMDISDTTAVASDVAQGKYFYLKTGQKVQGSNTSGGYISQDQNGYVVLSPTNGVPTLINKTITENGTYNPASDNATGYSSVTVSTPAFNIETVYAYGSGYEVYFSVSGEPKAFFLMMESSMSLSAYAQYTLCMVYDGTNVTSNFWDYGSYYGAETASGMINAFRFSYSNGTLKISGSYDDNFSSSYKFRLINIY